MVPPAARGLVEAILHAAYPAGEGISPQPKLVQELYGDDRRRVGLGARACCERARDTIIGLGAVSAAASLINLGTSVDFPPGVAYVDMPGQVMVAADAGKFVQVSGRLPPRDDVLPTLQC